MGQRIHLISKNSHQHCTALELCGASFSWFFWFYSLLWHTADHTELHWEFAGKSTLVLFVRNWLVGNLISVFKELSFSHLCTLSTIRPTGIISNVSVQVCAWFKKPMYKIKKKTWHRQDVFILKSQFIDFSPFLNITGACIMWGSRQTNKILK